MLDSYVVRRLAVVSVLSRRHAEAGTQMWHVDRRVDNGTGGGSLAGQPRQPNEVAAARPNGGRRQFVR